jgi:hypothetical protein
MRKLPLDQIEELVEESVFHPSPCKRHRERVLSNAIRATVQQKISRRMIVAASAAALVLGVGIVIARIATSSGEAVPNGTSASSPAVEATSATPAPQPTTGGSMGEGLYRSSDGTDGPDGQAGRRGGL